MVAVAGCPGFVQPSRSTRTVVKLEPGGFSMEVQPCGESCALVRNSQSSRALQPPCNAISQGRERSEWSCGRSGCEEDASRVHA
jgi:hypothetical protein